MTKKPWLVRFAHWIIEHPHPTTAVASCLLALGTGVAVIVAWVQIDDAVEARRAQNYLELRKTFLAVDKDLDVVDRSETYREDGACAAWNALKRYWYFTQTEYEIAQIDPYQQGSWKNAQLPQVMFALTKPSYRSTFWVMGNTRWTDPPAAADEKPRPPSEGAKFFRAIVTEFNKQPGAQKFLDQDPVQLKVCESAWHPTASSVPDANKDFSACGCPAASVK